MCHHAEILFEQGLWELSFITQELLPNIPVNFFPWQKIETIEFSKNTKYGILVFTSNMHSYHDVADVCERIKPTIIIHCSDEWGNKPELDSLSNYCQLYLRQYRHAGYPYCKNVTTIPLGYGVDMFSEPCAKTSLIPSCERSRMWSFVGNMKSDRAKMHAAFGKLGNGFFGNADKTTMKNMYLNSKFVPIGRGNLSLNCMRIYEALSAGALPVVVGSLDEIRETFIDEKIEGWVVASSWEEAAEKCRSVSDDEKIMNQKQHIAINDWRTRLEELQKKLVSKMH